MTPAKARRLSTRWLVAAVIVLVIATALDAVGIDLMTMPLQVGSAICVAKSMHHSGWQAGYRARDKESR